MKTQFLLPKEGKLEHILLKLSGYEMNWLKYMITHQGINIMILIITDGKINLYTKIESYWEEKEEKVVVKVILEVEVMEAKVRHIFTVRVIIIIVNKDLRVTQV